jgi:hypothetical protein
MDVVSKPDMPPRIPLARRLLTWVGVWGMIVVAAWMATGATAIVARLADRAHLERVAESGHDVASAALIVYGAWGLTAVVVFIVAAGVRGAVKSLV